MNRRKDVLTEHGPWHYAAFSEAEMPAVRAETWRAMEEALAMGKVHSLTLLRCHAATLSHFHAATLPRSHTATLSRCHAVTQ
eukprot:6198772-Pleurochrysis_carterae.AAC.2